ncbi:MAG: threonylcarbamoyl-AMP synthase [Planctomycetes bacterium]|nr:threonylcarbamoyl-AMP synthase [Planctomycetota bacterium]
MRRSTECLTIDSIQPEPDRIARAADVIRGGGLVAFPTETVYGLGANALDATAVARIFEAKGRPASNPIIVHVADVPAAKQLVSSWPNVASVLADKFWPGPLTFVLPRKSIIPDLVTAGGPTVGIRVPANAIALALLRAAGVPLAAPSANRSTCLSPTTAEHVRRSLDGRIDMILDGGPTTGGLESTVLDLCEPTPRILRPGLISILQIVSVTGGTVIQHARENPSGETIRSPGLMERHYAPRARVICVEDGGDEEVLKHVAAGARVGWITLDGAIKTSDNVICINLPFEAAAYAARLYSALHQLDDAGVDVIVAELPLEAPEWSAVRDRLMRAAALR